MVVGRCWAVCLAPLCVWENQVTAMQKDVCLNMKNMSKFLECLLITKNYGGKEVIQLQLTKLVGENGKILKEEIHWHEAEGCAL